jgi:hypothetical protein
MTAPLEAGATQPCPRCSELVTWKPYKADRYHPHIKPWGGLWLHANGTVFCQATLDAREPERPPVESKLFPMEGER